MGFLREFAECGNVWRSTLAAKISRETVYLWLAQPAFKALYDKAHEEALDKLEEEARRRGVVGVIKPVYQLGKRAPRKVCVGRAVDVST